MAVNPFPNDPVNADIVETAGRDLLYQNATGFEKALADTDAQRLTAIYAELPRDQWDPDKISYRNLAYLAWAMGVNLWEDDWDETFRRWWVKEQWTLKAQRGSLYGISRFVAAINGQIKRAITPPAICYPRRADTDDERAAYVARFPQLRLYPYVAREMLAYLCYATNFHAASAYSSMRFAEQPDAGTTITLNGTTVTFVAGVPGSLDVQIGEDLDETLDNLTTMLNGSADPQIAACEYVRVVDGPVIGIVHLTPGTAGNAYTLRTTAPVTFKRGMSTLLEGRDNYSDGGFALNGSFLGPERDLFPTVQNQGGNYTRTAKLWDRGVETTLTMRKVVNIVTGDDAIKAYTPGIAAYDEEVILPSKRMAYYIEEPDKYFDAGGKYGIFLSGGMSPLKTIIVPRSRPIVVESSQEKLWQYKAQYQTVLPDGQVLNLYPEHVATNHDIRPTELYASRGQYLYGKFLPRSNAWEYLYERWYLFDADRIPDYRRRGIYLDNTRLGIPKYTAELLIKYRTKHLRFKTQCSSYVYGHLCERDDSAIKKIRRSVTASMALRDTVLIDTRAVRRLQLRDVIDASGRVSIGQLVSA